MKINKVSILVGLALVAVVFLGQRLSKRLQPENHAEMPGCIYLSEDSLAMRNICDVPIIARLCTGHQTFSDTSAPREACIYEALAPDEKSPPNRDLATEGPAPDLDAYHVSACKAPYYPVSVYGESSSILVDGCLPEGERPEDAPPA